MKLDQLKEAAKYYDRGVFIDSGPFVIVRLWKGGLKVQDFATLKPKKVMKYDGTYDVEWADHPVDAKDAASRWASSVKEVEVNP